MRQVRSSLLDVLSQEYLRTARAKGLPEQLVVGRHAMRNALIPLTTQLGIDVASAKVQGIGPSPDPQLQLRGVWLSK